MKMMLVLGRTMVRSTTILLLLLLLVFFMMLFFGAFAWFGERGVYNPHLQQYLRKDGAPTPFLGIPDAMYWCMATMTTVGYGDLFPIGDFGRITGIIAMLSGTVILSLPITVIGATFSEEYQEQQRIAERQRRLNAHNLKIGLTKLKTGSFERMKEGTMRRINIIRKGVDDSAMKKPPKDAPITYTTPGLVECEWLLEEYRDTVVNDVKAMLAKGEADLMRMSRKCLIHSRVLSVTDDGVPVKLGAPSAGSSRSLLDLQTSAQVDAALTELEEELTQPRESETDIPSRRVRRT